MIKHFKEVLDTLKKIEKHLNKLSRCVNEGPHNFGDQTSISTKDWNSN